MRSLAGAGATSGCTEFPVIHVALVFPEKGQEALVVGGFHVEQTNYRVVASARRLQAQSDYRADVAARQVAGHERSMDYRPERLACRGHAAEQFVDRSAGRKIGRAHV